MLYVIEVLWTILFLCATFISQASWGQESLQVGTGKAKVGALLQFWGFNDTTAAADANSSFRVRRAELKLSGSVYEKTRWFLMVDPAKSLRTGAVSAANDNKILQDIGMGIMLASNLELVAGQFKIPTTNEGLISSAELLLPERSVVGRTFGDRREPGVMLDFNPKPFRARVMASNGQVTNGSAGTNVDDTNNSKDFSERVDYAFSENFSVGAFGSQSNSTAGFGERTGLNLAYNLERFLIGVEGVRAKELDIERTGMNVEAAYRLCDEWQVVGRYENFQTITTPGEVSSNAYTLGANYFLAGNNVKVQMAYTALNNMTTSQGTPAVSTGKNGGLTVLNAQTSF